MKLAMRLPARGPGKADANSDADPREEGSSEVIDLASRTAYPIVANRKGRSDGLALAGGIGFVALLGAATLWGLDASRMGSDEAAQPAAPAPPAPPVAGIAPPTPEQQAAIAAATPVAPADPAPSPVLAVPPHVTAMPVANPYASPTVVFDSSALPAPAAAVAAPGEQAGANNAPAQAGSAGDFASRLGGVGGAAATAASNFDPATTITQGTMIPAVLETAINTDVPGYVRAVVSQDVKSYDGRRILVPRSSRLIGQYQSGLQAGQKRAYVIWTRLIRPDGVSVALASPGTAFDGSGGLPGKVDTHFFQRFGSAMLLSVIGGLTAAVSSGTSLILPPAGGVGGAGGADIGPTIRVRMGEPIRVFTARDLDFSQAPRL